MNRDIGRTARKEGNRSAKNLMNRMNVMEEMKVMNG